MDYTEEITVEDIVACDGGELFGHPKIYLHLNKNKDTICPYCNRKLTLDSNKEILV